MKICFPFIGCAPSLEVGIFDGWSLIYLSYNFLVVRYFKPSASFSHEHACYNTQRGNHILVSSLNTNTPDACRHGVLEQNDDLSSVDKEKAIVRG